MSKSSKASARTWCWRRRVVGTEQELWVQRLQAAGCISWAFTERPGHVRVQLEAYLSSRATAKRLATKWGGRVRVPKASEWIKTTATPPTRIGKRLEIIHESTRRSKKSDVPRLYIPHGVAFGSGEHATTFVLVRELTRRKDWRGVSVLDLGTGSGVLALTARLLGAKKIVATDFDPDSVRTGRQNEALNFLQPQIKWRQADVLKLRSTARYHLVLANLFSGILGEAAPPIASSVAPGGQLWLSGILKSQESEVISAYRGQKLKLIRTYRRGKWAMLQWERPAPATGAALKTRPK